MHCCCTETSIESPIPPPASQPSPGELRRADGIVRTLKKIPSIAAFAGAFLLPKCPLCLAAWAATLGVGEAGRHLLLQGLGPHFRPGLVGLLVLPLLLQTGLWLWRRARNLTRAMLLLSTIP